MDNKSYFEIHQPFVGAAKEMVEILDMPLIIDDKTDKPLHVDAARIELDLTNSGW